MKPLHLTLGLLLLLAAPPMAAGEEEAPVAGTRLDDAMARAGAALGVEMRLATAPSAGEG